MGYAKVTLVSANANDNKNSDHDVVSVDVFLPEGVVPSETAENTNDKSNLNNNNTVAPEPLVYYYTGSRFEHGSMIGNLRYKGHTLYQTDAFRMPHNGNWPESGVGLASEFGVGDDGDFCFYRCGWPLEEDITNGVLGYRHAKNGQPFLKVGVGKLIKGSCPACDSTEDYKFNSPYMYAERPEWTLTQHSPQSLTLYHEASLQQQQEIIPTNNNQQPQFDPQQPQQQQQNQQQQLMLYQYGYQLQKDIRFTSPNVLSVTTTLTNTGREAFSTVWYSHNFFNCDQVAVGPGYAVDLNLNGSQRPLYEEPGTWSWSTPLKRYAQTITSTSYSPFSNNNDVRVEMTRALDPGIRIKSEFTRDDKTQGGFVVEACNTRIASTLQSGDGSNPQQQPPLEMYAYGLYIEREIFSPEPQILLHLPPGASRQFTQQLQLYDVPPTPTQPSSQWGSNNNYNNFNSHMSAAGLLNFPVTSSSSSTTPATASKATTSSSSITTTTTRTTTDGSSTAIFSPDASSTISSSAVPSHNTAGGLETLPQPPAFQQQPLLVQDTTRRTTDNDYDSFLGYFTALTGVLMLVVLVALSLYSHRSNEQPPKLVSWTLSTKRRLYTRISNVTASDNEDDYDDDDDDYDGRNDTTNDNNNKYNNINWKNNPESPLSRNRHHYHSGYGTYNNNSSYMNDDDDDLENDDEEQNKKMITTRR